MRRSPRRSLATMLLIFATLAATSVALAQSNGPYTSYWFTFAGGGASTGGIYTLRNVIGQTNAGLLSGGSYTMHTGFGAWFGMASTGTSTATPTGTDTPTHTFTPTETPTSTATTTVTPTPSRTVTHTPTATPTQTSTPTATRIWTSTHTLTPTPTPTGSRSPTLTDTPSKTPTITISPTSTITPSPTLSPPAGPPDFYEDDDTCARANALSPDGAFQSHNFHVSGDVDWIRFHASAGERYVIAATQVGARADVALAVYDACDGTPVQENDNFGRDTIMVWIAPTDGVAYLRVENEFPNGYGRNANYLLNIRVVTAGAAIIAGGRMLAPDEYQQQITHVSNHAYAVFRAAGFEAIYYLSADPTPPPYMNAPSSPPNLAYAITTWAPAHMDDGAPLYIYLVDHGIREGFYLDVGAGLISSEELDAWLTVFQNQRPNSRVVVMIEACKSGSFITPPKTISGPRRIVITSTDDSTDAIPKPKGQGGAYFSDPFLDALADNYDLWTSFRLARQAARPHQSAWLDGNGNGVPYPFDPADEGAGRDLGLARRIGLSNQSPYIEEPILPAPNGAEPVLIQVKVLDEDRPRVTAWLEVTRPSTAPPSPLPGYDTPISHAESITLTYNIAIDRFEVPFAFDEVGVYQFLIQAKDVDDLSSQPVLMTVSVGTRIFLPVIMK